MLDVTSAKGSAPFPTIHSFTIKKIIQFQQAFPFGTSIPLGERVNSQLGKEKKYPKLLKPVFLLLRQLYCTLHSTNLLKIGRCSFVHIDSLHYSMTT